MSTHSTLTAPAPDAGARAPHPVVVARDLVRRYGDGETAVTALDGVSLAVEAGELVAVMGPSGSGKSTLMHILAGLDRPSDGEVWIGDEEITRMGDNALTKLRRRHIGFVFQFFNLLPTLTAEENIALPTRIAGGRPDKRRLAEIIAAVGLTERRRHRPSQMSGGQQQRVAIARAMLSQPTVMFADEPTGNLDSRSSADVLRLLREAADELDQTIVMVTHDAAAAAGADRIVFLADGRVVREQGTSTTEQILDAMKEIA